MSNKIWYEKICDKVNYIVDHANLLNSWQQEFIDSMSIRISNNKEITWPMHKKINEAYKDVENKLGESGKI